MARRFLLCSSLLLVLTAPQAFAAAYDSLQLDLHAASGALHQETMDHAADMRETATEAKNEFFPATGTGIEKVTMDPGAAAGVVSFRIAGVPYLLNDVPVGAWFAPYVRSVAEQGIVSGYKDADGMPTGIFGPARNVSIEELAKMSIEASRIDKAGCTAAAKNPAAAQSWSSLYIACAEEHSFAVYSDGTADLKRPATRGEVVMTILQAFGVPPRDIKGTTPIFKDVDSSTLFSSAINTAVQDNIVSGYTDAAGNPTGFFGPDKSINRAEIAKMLSIAVQVYRK